MSMVYADRGFISINGARIADVTNITLRRNRNAKAVPTMTPDGFNRGFVKGNMDIDVDFSLAVENQLATPKLETIDYEANDVQLSYIVGADQYICTGLFPKEDSLTNPGVGEVAKKDFKFGALKVTDAIGNSVLFGLDLE